MNRSLMLAKLLAFIYYSPGEFEDFFVGLAADPSEVNCDGNIMLSKEYFTISKAESGDAALEVIRYLTLFAAFCIYSRFSL
jgi:hypothetical protein